MFEHIEQFLSLVVDTNNPCIVLFVLIHKTDVPYGVCLAELVFAVWHNGIALLIQIAYGNASLKMFLGCMGKQLLLPLEITGILYIVAIYIPLP